MAELDDDDEELLEESRKPKGVPFIESVKELLTHGVLLPVRGPLKRVRTGKPAPRILALRAMILKAVMQMLVEKGGWVFRENLVIGDRLRKGRIWDRGIWEVLPISYTDASLELLIKLAENNPTDLPQLVEALKDLGPKTLGDQLLVFLVLDKVIGQMILGQFDPDQLQKLLELSSFLALRYPDLYQQTPAKINTLLSELIKGDPAILLVYLGDNLVKSWIKAEQNRRKGLPNSVGRYRSLANFFQALVRAAGKTGRLDALYPILRFFEEYVINFGQREAVVEAFKEGVKTLRLASQQQEALSQIGELFEVANALEKVAQRILATPFPDRTLADKTFIADYQSRFKALQSELVAIRRELGGEVG